MDNKPESVQAEYSYIRKEEFVLGIAGQVQPDILEVNSNIRLRKFDGHFEFALAWYQNIETVYLVDGIKEPYDFIKLNRMYSYLNDRGELYFIEVLDGTEFLPIGDVAFWQNDMPIVIGDPLYRGHGIGKHVISRLVERGRELSYPALYVNEIYKYNIASQKAFESVGFRKFKETSSGFGFCYKLTK